MAKSMLDVEITMPDIKYFAKQISRIKFDIPFEETCREVIKDTRKRLRAGQRMAGGRYPGLAEQTIVNKMKGDRKRGYPALGSRAAAKIALIWTGRMQKSLSYEKVKKNFWRIWFKGARNTRIAKYHIFQGASRSRVLRPFFMPYLTTKQRSRHSGRVRKFLSKQVRIIEGDAQRRSRKIK